MPIWASTLMSWKCSLPLEMDIRIWLMRMSRKLAHSDVTEQLALGGALLQAPC